MSRGGAITRGVLLLFSAFTAAIVLYGLLNLQRTSSGLTMVILFGVMPILCLLSTVIALRAKPLTRAKACLAIFGCVVAVYAGELVLVLWGNIASRTHGELSTDNSFDGRHKLQVVLDMRAEGTDAAPSIEPKSLLWSGKGETRRSGLSDDGEEILPLGGIANRQTVLCNEPGQWIIHMSDRYGMNNPDDVWNHDAIEIAVVGDSYANGWCCEPEDHFVSLIRDRYSDTVNLGMSGNGPLLVLAGVLEYLPSLRPKKVLWFHYEGNDFQDLAIELNASLLMRYLEAGFTQNLRERQASIDREIEAYVDSSITYWQSSSATIDELKLFAKLRRLRFALGLKYDPSPDHELFVRILTRAKTAVESWGGELYFVYLPASDRYRSGWSGTYESVRERVQTDVTALGIEFIGVHQPFRAHEKPLSLFIPIRGGRRVGQYGHYSAEGNQLVTTSVFNVLSNGK